MSLDVGMSKKCIAIFCLMLFFLAAFVFVGCGDDSSASVDANDELGIESSSSVILKPKAEESSSSSAKSSSSSIQKNSSSSEKAKSSSSSVSSSSKKGDSGTSAGMTSSSEKASSSSSVKSNSSSSVILSASEESSSSSVDPISSSSLQGDKLSSSSSEKQSVSSSSEGDVSSSSSEDKVNCSALLEGETGWNWNVPKECRFNPDIDYGSMTDSRDGKVYRTVTIGKQTWMAENLNYYDATNLSVKTQSWCYGKSDNKDASTCNVAGRLYTWAAAIDSVKLANDVDNPQDCGFRKTCTLPAKVQGVCPPDWHLPSRAEWKALLTAVGGQSSAGKVLKSQSGWHENGNGTDAFGFSALPAGDKYYKGDFSNEGRLAEFWSSTEYINSDEAYHMDLSYEDGYANLSGYAKYYGFSVRCVKN